MIDRYISEEMRAVWSDEAKYTAWRNVEVSLIEGLMAQDIIPKDDGTLLVNKLNGLMLNIDDIRALEKEFHHDVVAFVVYLERHCGDVGRYIHLGLTSSDVVDTAYGKAINSSFHIIKDQYWTLINALKQLAVKHTHTLQAGRTHGQYAELTTFGIKVSGWVDMAARNFGRIQTTVDSASVGKLSGPVGTNVSIPDSSAKHAATYIGSSLASHATQVVPRDRHAAYFQALAMFATTLEYIATEIRLLSASGIEEVKEGFGENQKGSSSMPHKTNPIKCENICGLARLVRSYADSAMSNVVLWHERDISHSSVERIIGPDANAIVEYMTESMSNVISSLYVDADKMAKNIMSSHEVMLSHTYLCALVKSGMSRELAHKLMQTACEQVKLDNTHLSVVLSKMELPISKEEIFGIANTYTNELLSRADIIVRECGSGRYR